MKIYIVYDKRTGEILHKYRNASIEQGDQEDTLECRPEEVLSSYRRREAPDEQLGVALLAEYHPRSSRGRVTRYDESKGHCVHEASTPGKGSAVRRSSVRKPTAEAGKE